MNVLLKSSDVCGTDVIGVGFIRCAYLALCLISAGLVPLLSDSSPARADDHIPPALIARAGKQEQLGQTWSDSWVGSDSHGGCVFSSGDGAAIFRKKAPKFRAPNLIHLEFTKVEGPESVQIILARKIRERSRTASGPRTRPRFAIEPVTDEEGAITSWEAVFRGARERHYYITVYASWQDTEGCGGVQSVAYVVHLQGV